MEETVKLRTRSSVTAPNPLLKNKNKPSSKIYVKFRVFKVHHIYDTVPSDIRETYIWGPSIYELSSISCNGSKLLNEEEEQAKQQALEFLRGMEIHPEEHLRILTAVWAKIQKLAVRTTSKTYANLFVGIDVVKRELYDQDAFMRAAMESMEDDTDRKVPASESSIAGLERCVFGDENLEEKKCVICLEEMEMGMEAIRMPCSHFYHQDCIVQWLHKSHLCPLCRYKMPVEEE
ncbi:uncharacterized RING finger protein C57A7.09-like [Mercurialis annua]|uniref:uncharacterized RING finger protein C57A7.09-like n=1 Tax=Mercurialis annua TaxID=3986 RepID=UPI0024AD7DE8|nr:uncharacterized RING finger protein C57A7.09-like [Mercurialis annua]